MASSVKFGIPSVSTPQVVIVKDLEGEAIKNLVMTTDEDYSMEFKLNILQLT